jgi:hypothetical protein
MPLADRVLWRWMTDPRFRLVLGLNAEALVWEEWCVTRRVCPVCGDVALPTGECAYGCGRR